MKEQPIEPINNEPEELVAPPPTPELEEMETEETLDPESQFAWCKY